jgi:hypothetical protein
MDIVVGQEVPVFTRRTGFHAWNRYAAVNSEFVDIHMDDDAGRAAGYPGAFGMGNLQTAWLHCMLREWLDGSGGRIVSFSCQFRNPSLKDRVVEAHGVVTGVRTVGGEVHADLDVWTEDDQGARLAPARVTVAVPSIPSD